jgi:hypothetical protein
VLSSGLLIEPVLGVDFSTKIKLDGPLGMRAFRCLERISGDFFYFDTAGSLDWRGFLEADFAKYCLQRT